MTALAELKQACLDLAGAAGELFDRFEEHGYEAAWEGDGVLVVMRMEEAHEKIRGFLAHQSTSRLIALGVNPATLLKRMHGE